MNTISRIEIQGFPVNAITAIQFKGRPCVLASELAEAMGYENPKRLSEYVSGKWSEDFVEGKDFDVIRGGELKDLRVAVPDLGTAKTRAILVLYESGVDLACLNSRTEVGRRLRRY